MPEWLFQSIISQSAFVRVEKMSGWGECCPAAKSKMFPLESVSGAIAIDVVNRQNSSWKNNHYHTSQITCTAQLFLQIPFICFVIAFRSRIFI